MVIIEVVYISVKKLSRGISRATDNLNLVSQARSECAVHFSAAAQNLASNNAGYSFTLPDLTIYNKEFKWYLEKDLIEMATQTTLETTERLNWWLENGGKGLCQKLWTLNTTGDGNCLLHAASLGIWGFHDRLLTLRGALHSFFSLNQHNDSLYRRWRWQQMKLNDQLGLKLDELQWANEWQAIINMSSTEPRNSGNNMRETAGLKPSVNRIYESLEEIHVLALAYVLKRPIIIISDVVLRNLHNEPLAPIFFGGIYLPLEMAPSECHRSPLLLTYDTSHFCALVAMETTDKCKQSLVPIMDSTGILLPVNFCIDPGVNHNWSTPYDQKHINNLILNEKDLIVLLKKYMDVVDPTELDQAASPDPDSEDEIDKRFVECNDASENDNDNALFAHKNKATKQLQSVAKQFGSIGKSMSKKIKKNFGSIAKPSKTKKVDSSKRMLLVELHIKNTDYRESMVKNYMEFMMKKFSEEGNRVSVTSPSVDIMEELKLQEQSSHDETSFKCINANCEFFGTAMTSYMCHKCYEKQKDQELTIKTDSSRFGTGRSQFYRNSDHSSYDALRNIPVVKPNTNHNRTLYLSHSTFYCDTDIPLDMGKTEQPEVKRPVAPSCTITSNSENNNNQNNNNNFEASCPPYAMENYYDTLLSRTQAKTSGLNRERSSNLSRSAMDIMNSGSNTNSSLAPRHISEVNLNILKPHLDSTYVKLGPAMGHEIGKENIPCPAIENAHQFNYPPSSATALQSRREEPPEREATSGLGYRCRTVRCPNTSSSADTYCTECFKKNLKRILPH